MEAEYNVKARDMLIQQNISLIDYFTLGHWATSPCFLLMHVIRYLSEEMFAESTVKNQ